MPTETPKEASKKKTIDWINLLNRLITNITKTANLLSVLGVLIACWGIMLTCKNNSLSANMLALQAVQTDQAKKQTYLEQAQLKLQQKQDTTSLDIQHFNQLLIKIDTLLKKDSALVELSTNQISDLSGLLNKTDNIIALSNSQLRLNRDVQENANNFNRSIEIADMNKLAFDSRNIEKYAFYEFGMPESLDLIDTITLAKYIHILDSLAGMMDKDRYNSFLNRNDELQLQWTSAYEGIYSLKGEIKDNYNRWYSDGEIRDGVPEKMRIHLAYLGKYYGRLVWNTAIAALNTINSEKIRKNYPILFYAGDKVFLKTNPNIKYVVIGDDFVARTNTNTGLQYMCQRDSVGARDTLYIPSAMLRMVSNNYIGVFR